MKQKTNYAKINDDGKLEIHTDNATFVDGETHTSIGGKTFEISGEDLMKIYALLQDREITQLLNVRDDSHFPTINNYVIVGKDVEKMVLSRGLRYHLEDRVLVHDNKTVVFA